MYFSIHYENGASNFQYEVNTPGTDIKAVMMGVESFFETTMEEGPEESEEPENGEEDDGAVIP
jgi:hypothetical protein